MQTTQSGVLTIACPQEHVRNVCILAHVDHGKTTCADNLISSNGIISRQSAGKIRYMDSRLDEQERQITMKSSSIALRWVDPIGEGARPTYLINLIDSPGHVDFTSEVSSAARLADGALIVVDVVEGVEAQTRTVLRQAWRDRVKTCLLLNKVDRLITELELTPLEAYQRIVKILEEINMANAQLVSEEAMAKVAEEIDAGNTSGATDLDLASAGVLEFNEDVEEAWRYSPERGNVAFGSASHGWAFRVDTFARIIAGKMGANPKNFQKVLWGNWAFNKKTKHAQRRSADDTKTKPMFVEFILQPLFAAYGACAQTLDVELLTKMQSQMPAWKDVEVDRLTAGSGAVRELMGRWLPFADCILQMATEHMPSPIDAVANRLPVLCPRWFAGGVKAVTVEHRTDIADGLRASDRNGATVAYLTKFLAADLGRCVLTDDSLIGDGEMQFVGLTRVFSGTIRQEQTLYVQKEDGDKVQQRVLKVKRIFQLMGRFMQEITEAPSGSIVAVSVVQLDESGSERLDMEMGVERCLTFCDSADGPCFETPYSSQAFAIVRVSIEPKNVTDLDALDRGLRLLHKADPSVSVQAMVTGENVLGCCGDEHLKRCLSDLQKVYARNIPLSISTPLVAVRESLTKSVTADRLDKKDMLFLPVWASHLVDASTEASSQFSAPGSEHEQESEVVGAPKIQERISMNNVGIMSVWTANRKACLRISAIVLPSSVLEWMDVHAEELESVVHRQRPSVAFAGEKEQVTLGECLAEISQQFGQRMCAEEGSECPGVLCGISVAKGSRAVLLDATSGDWTLGQSYQGSTEEAKEQEANIAGEADQQRVPFWMRPSVLSGFQLAANAGPLCEEPMRGVAFVLHGCQIIVDDAPGGGYPGDASALSATAQPYGPMSGQMMVAMKEACRYCLFRRGFARISEVMLALEVHCEMDMLGKVHGVLGKRRCRVMDEGLREGTSLFYIRAFLPLADSFGLSNDLRFAASGKVSFHCAFSHWELSEDDPFQEASLTPEEVEELGDQPLPPNKARKLIDGIRKRKGLPTDEKVVKFGSQQSTLTKMK